MTHDATSIKARIMGLRSSEPEDAHRVLEKLLPELVNLCDLTASLEAELAALRKEFDERARGGAPGGAQPGA
jgi:hypothetical protein